MSVFVVYCVYVVFVFNVVNMERWSGDVTCWCVVLSTLVGMFVWIQASCSSVLCVLRFLGMSKRVNVMLCLMYVSSPPPNFYVCAYVSVVCYFVCFGCGREFVFLYCDDVLLCCVCELSELLLFVCDSIDVYL